MTKTGYGLAWNKRLHRMTTAHRLVWEKAHGPIAEGLVIHHTCKNRKCLNLEHMELMTQAEHNTLHKTRKWWKLGDF